MNSAYDRQQGTGRTNTLSVVLIGPDETRRRALAEAFERQQAVITGELGAYPNFNHLLKLTESDCDVVVVDVDADVEVALDLIENICSRNSALTVMVYSGRRDPEFLVRCMRAGAREFLSEPLSADTVLEAVVSASARRLDLDRQKKLSGKLLVFRGAKGGTGVTTLASNFAIALKNESGRDVVLVDLDLQLGAVAVVLGLEPRFTVADALANPDRLDRDFVSTLLADHRSGLSVLAAPEEYGPVPAVQGDVVGKLLYVLRNSFPYVVVDAGTSLGLATDTVLQMADVIYLVMQVDIPTLRNARRLISYLQRPSDARPHVEVVFNRYDKRKLGVDEARIHKAISLPLKWKIPSDYVGVRQSLDTGTPLALGNSPVALALREMARAACGKDAEKKKSKWKLF